MAKQQDNFIPIGNWNLGGLADSKFSGIKNSSYKLIGWDLHSTPGLLKVAQKLTKDTGTTITAFCRARVSASTGIQYWFSYTDGKIWQNKAGVWTLVYTTSPAAGAAGCLGAVEYQGYIYWVTQSRLHRIAVASADGAAAWTANAVPNWATFSITDSAFHPMIEQNLVLYIGDGNYLAQVDAGVFTANALDIKTPLRVKSLGKMGTDVLLGTYVASTVTETEIIRWNTYSVSFTSSDSIPEVGINAFLPSDNFVLVQAGLKGNIYLYNGERLELYGKIPGNYSPSSYGEVYPESVANLAGLILFGFSNGSGNPADQGVYQIGRATRNHPWVLDMPFPISERSGGSLVMSSIEIGGVLAVGSDLYVAWKNGSTYGIDKLDYSNKLEAGYLETRVMVVTREKFTNFSKFVVAYASLPASTAINIAYDKNHAGEPLTETTEVIDSDRKIVYAEEGVEATTLRLKISPTVSSNNAPEIESAGVFLS
ncbi:hypothetical protein FJY90_02885 [Candidatus Gottesmanbacteria bacterium]|nr:hypothetical protein [Candidatus Gottesmanbacteria bacterium]